MHQDRENGSHSSDFVNLRVLASLWSLVAMAYTCGSAAAQVPDAKLEDYSQWKLALPGGSVADPVSIAAPKDFAVEVVRAAGEGEGSWISLAFDPQGRLVIGREDKGLLRLPLNADGTPGKLESIDNTLLEPRGLLFAHDSLYVTANNSKGFYRLRDEDGDGRFEEPKLLKTLEGGVGHGRNGMALGPDGMIYMACGNNVRVPADVAKTSPYQNYGLDRLLPCDWNEFLFDSDVVQPAGFVLRTDKDGQKWELVAGGFRNPMDLASSDRGELFTYDADMEWDVGAPWYRPTTVIHVVPGGEYGWRQGTNVWPDFFPDALPRVLDIGLGSPTGVAFGTNSKFPAKYRKVLFICDWAYGRIIAVHLSPRGESFGGTAETFLKGKPLNLTDIAFGPDGAMYFTVGGRGTKSAVYRVRYAGNETTDLDPEFPTSKSWPRAQLLHVIVDELGELTAGATGEERASSIAALAKALAADDPYCRLLARSAVERYRLAPSLLPEDDGGSETERLLALARTSDRGELPKVAQTAASLAGERWEKLSGPKRLTALRAIQLCLIRGKAADEGLAQSLNQRLEPIFPARTYAENYLLCELLVALNSSQVAAKSLPLLESAKNDSERLFFLYTLRNVKNGWTLDLRTQFLMWLKRAEGFDGAHYMTRFLTFIRSDAVATLTDEERQALAPLLKQLGQSAGSTGPLVTNRPKIKEWTLDQLTPALDGLNNDRDLARGKKMFAEALCIRCHRLGGEGGVIGPNLAGLAGRFSRRDILIAIVDPSREVEEKYRNMLIRTQDGQTITGLLAGGNKEVFYIAPDPLVPADIRTVPRSQVTTRSTSPVSTMPKGLLDTLSREEILDLLAYLEREGK